MATSDDAELMFRVALKTPYPGNLGDSWFSCWTLMCDGSVDSSQSL